MSTMSRDRTRIFATRTVASRPRTGCFWRCFCAALPHSTGLRSLGPSSSRAVRTATCCEGGRSSGLQAPRRASWEGGMESAGGEKEAPSSASPSSSSGSLLPAEKSTKPQPLEHGKEEPGAASVAMGQAQGPPSAAPLSVAPKTATPTPAPNLHPTHNNAAASPAGSANDGDWGWDAMGSEDGDDGSDAGGHPLSPGPSPTSPPPSNAMNECLEKLTFIFDRDDTQKITQ